MARIFITATDGKVVPLHSSDATGPGATNLLVRPGDVVEVEKSAAIIRRLRAGDLVEVAAPTALPAKER